MVVAQLVEQSLLIPEVHGSNPVIHKIYIEHLFTVNCIENREKEAGNGPLSKKDWLQFRKHLLFKFCCIVSDGTKMINFIKLVSGVEFLNGQIFDRS